MKKVLFALILAMQSMLGAEALAAPCAMSNLSAYLGLGAAGCTIGNLRFSNFALLAQPTDSIPFASISVTPFAMGANNIGLDFGVNQSDGPGVPFLDNLISYRVTALGGSITGASLFFTGSSSTGDGVVTVIENLCIGGLFLGVDGVSLCSGIPRDLIVVNIGGIADPMMSVAFLSAGALAVVTDIGVDGGLAGTASLQSASNRFRFVPEPGTLLLMAAGLLALFGFGAARAVRIPRLA